mmetsp:Transcript_8871/g.27297  ORF Transcript_8871/g.27297 Transcript_8871/m.27297 type:complete len:218 (+) Transcript_8871:1181-1834(+)
MLRRRRRCATSPSESHSQRRGRPHRRVRIAARPGRERRAQRSRKHVRSHCSTVESRLRRGQRPDGLRPGPARAGVLQRHLLQRLLSDNASRRVPAALRRLLRRLAARPRRSSRDYAAVLRDRQRGRCNDLHSSANRRRARAHRRRLLQLLQRAHRQHGHRSHDALGVPRARRRQVGHHALDAQGHFPARHLVQVRPHWRPPRILACFFLFIHFPVDM